MEKILFIFTEILDYVSSFEDTKVKCYVKAKKFEVLKPFWQVLHLVPEYAIHEIVFETDRVVSDEKKKEYDSVYNSMYENFHFTPIPDKVIGYHVEFQFKYQSEFYFYLVKNYFGDNGEDAKENGTK
jgi:hypothetical protein